ncbi:MAG: hypothetical protein K0Q68_250 [Moraxellaceae bacterium]|nr:hypothetical protein [Moraxellaceae bacterium]
MSAAPEGGDGAFCERGDGINPGWREQLAE